MDANFLKSILPLSDPLNDILKRIFEPNPDKRITIRELKERITCLPCFTRLPSFQPPRAPRQSIPVSGTVLEESSPAVSNSSEESFASQFSEAPSDTSMTHSVSTVSDSTNSEVAEPVDAYRSNSEEEPTDSDSGYGSDMEEDLKNCNIGHTQYKEAASTFSKVDLVEEAMIDDTTPAPSPVFKESQGKVYQTPSPAIPQQLYVLPTHAEQYQGNSFQANPWSLPQKPMQSQWWTPDTSTAYGYSAYPVPQTEYYYHQSGNFQVSDWRTEYYPRYAC
jgi:hypothetical protein